MAACEGQAELGVAGREDEPEIHHVRLLMAEHMQHLGGRQSWVLMAQHTQHVGAHHIRVLMAEHMQHLGARQIRVLIAEHTQRLGWHF